MSFFFFFQAEDGIRDYKVTGVQTCALPISRHSASTRCTCSQIERSAESVSMSSDRKSTRELQSPCNLVCRLLLEKKKKEIRTGGLFAHADLEQRVPESHPLRLIRRIVNQGLAALDGEFWKLYAAEGRPSIAPERLLRALLLQAFYSIRSERQLMEQLHYNLLYRWFVGLGVDDRVWVPTVFTKNRDRLLEAEVARKFLAVLLAHRQVRALLSDDHFSVDGTQVQAWASM